MGGKVYIEEILVIDNKNNSKCHGEILSEIHIKLSELLYSGRHKKPDLFIREAAVGTFCHKTTMILNKVVGVTDMFLWDYAMKEWKEPYRPTSIKKIITGSGKASKEEVSDAVQLYLAKPMEFEGDDESDAIAVAIAWLINHGLLERKEVKKDEPDKS